jgi:2-C-methyl-D-erythritol 4-phosphate cytidylyltransferase
MKNVAIIVAGGQGRRMGRSKQFLKLDGKPMLEWTLSVFQAARKINSIILVVGSENLARARRLKYSKLISVVPGGKERADSVRRGLKELPANAGIVLVHDGARPAVTDRLIEASIAAADKYGAAVVAVPVKDTIKKVKAGGMVAATLERNELWAAQTPQTFKLSVLRAAYRRPGSKATDDAMMVEKMGKKVKIVPGEYENFKVTTPADLKMMENILKDRR